jgi:hypothetical protein
LRQLESIGVQFNGAQLLQRSPSGLSAKPSLRGKGDDFLFETQKQLQ